MWRIEQLPLIVRRSGRFVVRSALGLAVLAVIADRIGFGPFLRGIRSLTWPAILAALVITALTTLCSAWRWVLVARRLEVALPLPVAVTAYYRSQFLNSVLPGGVLGDVHRAVVHGRDAGDVGRGLRAVAWERTAGQVVQAAVALVVLAVFPSPLRHVLPLALAALVGVLVVATAAGALVARHGGRSRIARAVRAVTRDARDAPLARQVWPRVAGASLVVIAGHTTVFVLAARTAGSHVPLADLVPLAVLAQLAMSMPLTIAGWGLREGAVAWAFAASGFGAGAGVAVATLYGVLALIATAPGAAVLAVETLRRAPSRRRSHPAPRPRSRPSHAFKGAVRG